jgi:hypothetical protein
MFIADRLLPGSACFPLTTCHKDIKLKLIKNNHPIYLDFNKKKYYGQYPYRAAGAGVHRRALQSMHPHRTPAAHAAVDESL